MPKSLASFFTKLEKNIDKVHRLAVEKANKELDEQDLLSADIAADAQVETAVGTGTGTVSETKAKHADDFLPRDYLQRREADQKKRHAMNRAWFEGRKAKWKAENDNWCKNLGSFLSDTYYAWNQEDQVMRAQMEQKYKDITQPGLRKTKDPYAESNLPGESTKRRTPAQVKALGMARRTAPPPAPAAALESDSTRERLAKQIENYHSPFEVASKAYSCPTQLSADVSALLSDLILPQSGGGHNSFLRKASKVSAKNQNNRKEKIDAPLPPDTVLQVTMRRSQSISELKQSIEKLLRVRYTDLQVSYQEKFVQDNVILEDLGIRDLRIAYPFRIWLNSAGGEGAGAGAPDSEQMRSRLMRLQLRLKPHRKEMPESKSCAAAVHQTTHSTFHHSGQISHHGGARHAVHATGAGTHASSSSSSSAHKGLAARSAHESGSLSPAFEPPAEVQRLRRRVEKMSEKKLRGELKRLGEYTRGPKLSLQIRLQEALQRQLLMKKLHKHGHDAARRGAPTLRVGATAKEQEAHDLKVAEYDAQVAEAELEQLFPDNEDIAAFKALQEMLKNMSEPDLELELRIRNLRQFGPKKTKEHRLQGAYRTEFKKAYTVLKMSRVQLETLKKAYARLQSFVHENEALSPTVLPAFPNPDDLKLFVKSIMDVNERRGCPNGEAVAILDDFDEIFDSPPAEMEFEAEKNVQLAEKRVAISRMALKEVKVNALSAGAPLNIVEGPHMITRDWLAAHHCEDWVDQHKNAWTSVRLHAASKSQAQIHADMRKKLDEKEKAKAAQAMQATVWQLRTVEEMRRNLKGWAFTAVMSLEELKLKLKEITHEQDTMRAKPDTVQKSYQLLMLRDRRRMVWKLIRDYYRESCNKEQAAKVQAAIELKKSPKKSPTSWQTSYKQKITALEARKNAERHERIMRKRAAAAVKSQQ